MLSAMRRVHTRVLVLPGKDAIEDRVLGLDAGADDHSVKPFAFPELPARVRAPVYSNREYQLLEYVLRRQGR